MEFKYLPQEIRDAVDEISGSASFLNKMDPENKYFQTIASETDSTEAFTRKLKVDIGSMERFIEDYTGKDSLNPKNWQGNEQNDGSTVDWRDLPRPVRDAILEVTDKTRVANSFQPAMMRMVFEVLRNTSSRSNFLHNMHCLMDDLEDMISEWRDAETLDPDYWE